MAAVKAYRHIQPIENWGISCRIPEPDIFKLNLDTLVLCTQVANIQRDQPTFIAICLAEV